MSVHDGIVWDRERVGDGMSGMTWSVDLYRFSSCGESSVGMVSFIHWLKVIEIRLMNLTFLADGAFERTQHMCPFPCSYVDLPVFRPFGCSYVESLVFRLLGCSSSLVILASMIWPDVEWHPNR